MNIRKRYRVLILAAIAVAVIVPFGFALSLEQQRPMRLTAAAPIFDVGSPSLGPALFDVSHRSTTFQSSLPFRSRVPDSAGLFIIGAVLIGAAIAVRRVS